MCLSRLVGQVERPIRNAREEQWTVLLIRSHVHRGILRKNPREIILLAGVIISAYSRNSAMAQLVIVVAIQTGNPRHVLAAPGIRILRQDMSMPLETQSQQNSTYIKYGSQEPYIVSAFSR